MNLRVNILLLVLLLASGPLTSQNLVPNPSFENLSSCPTANSQFNLATPWQKPLSSITTPDVFNSCFTGGFGCNDMGVPGNFAGTASPRTGNGYAGILTRYSVSNLREYLVIQLSSPLQSGVSYEVGAYIQLAEFSRFSTNNFGLHLSSGMLSQTGGCCNNGTINITPTFEEANVVSNRNGWTLVGGTYIASGGEEFLTIGCFSTDNQNTILDHGFQGGGCVLTSSGAYYYIDDVFVYESTPLAVNGLNFVASIEAEQSSRLNWTFEDASVYQTIVLERSADGVYFSDLTGEFPAMDGAFLDEEPYVPESYYRLRTVDQDGKTHRSEIQQLSFASPVAFTVRAWPNPLQDHLTVEISSDFESADYRLELQSYLGQTILVQEAKVSGTEQIRLDQLGTLSSGVYFLKVSHGGTQEVLKLTRL